MFYNALLNSIQVLHVLCPNHGTRKDTLPKRPLNSWMAFRCMCRPKKRGFQAQTNFCIRFLRTHIHHATTERHILSFDKALATRSVQGKMDHSRQGILQHPGLCWKGQRAAGQIPRLDLTWSVQLLGSLVSRTIFARYTGLSESLMMGQSFYGKTPCLTSTLSRDIS